jgi:hypothetical protein
MVPMIICISTIEFWVANGRRLSTVLAQMAFVLLLARMQNFGVFLYGMPKTKTYTFNKYGEFDCTMLAKEWVRRSEFVFLMFLADETWVNFQYSDADKASYEEPVEFADWFLTLPAGSESRARAEEVRLMSPKRLVIKL